MSQFFRNLKTAQKLGLGFGLCLVLSVVVGAVAIQRMAQMDRITKLILSDSLAGVDSLGKFQAGARQFRTVEFRHVLSFTPAQMDQAEADLVTSQAAADKALDGYGATLADPTDRANFTALKQDWQGYVALKEQLLPLSRANNIKACAALMNGPFKLQFNKITGDLDAMVQWNDGHADAYSRQATAAYTGARGTILVLLALAVVLGTATALFITRYMTGALSQVSGRLEKLRGLCITNFAAAIRALEGGDLTCPIATGTEPLTLDSRDEFGRMAQTFNAMLDQVKSTVGSFRASQASLSDLVRGLQQSSAQVASASGTLAAVSAQVGAATEQISATMGEVSQASEQSARGASEIAQGSTSQARSLS